MTEADRIAEDRLAELQREQALIERAIAMWQSGPGQTAKGPPPVTGKVVGRTRPDGFVSFTSDVVLLDDGGAFVAVYTNDDWGTMRRATRREEAHFRKQVK